MKNYKIVLAVFACWFVSASSNILAQEGTDFMVSGSYTDSEGFQVHESYILPLTEPEDIAFARSLLSSSPPVGDWVIAAEIEVCNDGSNRNHNVVGAPAWSWCVSKFLGFEDMRATDPVPAPSNMDNPSKIDEDPVAWITANGNVIAFTRFRLSMELVKDTNSGLINVSARGFAGIGENTLVAGLIVPEGSIRTLLLKGVGPSLTDKNIENALGDPKISLYGSDGWLLAANDNWKEGQSQIPFSMVPSFLEPSDDLEAALIVTLTEGLYTIHLSSSDGASSGIALVEVFDLGVL